MKWDKEGNKNIIVTVIAEPDPTQDPGVDQLSKDLTKEVSENPSSGDDLSGLQTPHITRHSPQTLHLCRSFALLLEELLNALLGKIT